MTIRVLVGLLMSPLHLFALQRGLGAMSEKVLTETLRRLEHDGLVTRRPEAHQSAVQYSLTALGPQPPRPAGDVLSMV